MGWDELFLEYTPEPVPESELSYDLLSVPGNLLDHAVSADGSTRVLSKVGDDLHLHCFAPDGTLERGDIHIGDGSAVSTSFGVFMSRVSKHAMVAWRHYSTTHEEFRYAYLDGDCNVLTPETALWTHDYLSSSTWPSTTGDALWWPTETGPPTSLGSTRTEA